MSTSPFGTKLSSQLHRVTNKHFGDALHFGFKDGVGDLDLNLPNCADTP